MYQLHVAILLMDSKLHVYLIIRGGGLIYETIVPMQELEPSTSYSLQPQLPKDMLSWCPNIQPGNVYLFFSLIPQ